MLNCDKRGIRPLRGELQPMMCRCGSPLTLTRLKASGGDGMWLIGHSECADVVSVCAWSAMALLARLGMLLKKYGHLPSSDECRDEEESMRMYYLVDGSSCHASLHHGSLSLSPDERVARSFGPVKAVASAQLLCPCGAPADLIRSARDEHGRKDEYIIGHFDCNESPLTRSGGFGYLAGEAMLTLLLANLVKHGRLPTRQEYLDEKEKELLTFDADKPAYYREHFKRYCS